jgi:hypothetical protein
VRLLPGVPTEAVEPAAEQLRAERLRAETPFEAKQRSRRGFQISAKTSGWALTSRLGEIGVDRPRPLEGESDTYSFLEARSVRS